MGSFPALMIKPPESPLQQFGEAIQIKTALQQQQLGEVQLQEARRQQESETELMAAFSRNGGDFNKTYADAANSGKVTPTMLNQFRIQSITAQTQAANLTEKQLENFGRMQDVAARELQSVAQMPEAQRTQGIKDALGRMANEGVDISKVVPALSQLPDFSDASLRSLEIGLKGEQWVYANEKAAREARQAPTDAEVEAQRQATLKETIEKGNQAAAETSLALERKRQMGTVTPEDVYKEQQANYRATLQRQATFAQGLQKNGLEQLDKIFTDPQHGYTQFLSNAQAVKNAVMQARNGSELAANLEPIMTASGVLSFAGIHRINQVDVNSAGPEVGSLYRRINAILDKVGSGSVPEDTQKEMIALMDGLADAKHSSLINAANMVVANAGLDPKKTMVMNRDGVITSLDKAQEGNHRTITPPVGGRQVGDTVSIKGKSMRITKVYPDGTFDAE